MMLRLIVPSLALGLLANAACVGREFQPTPTPRPIPSPVLERSYIQTAPDGYYLALSCLDPLGDHAITVEDFANDAPVDVNLDGAHNDADLDAYADLEIRLKPSAACDSDAKRFLTTPRDFQDEACSAGNKSFVIIAGITGASPLGIGVADEAAGMRGLLSRMRGALSERSVASMIVLSTPNLPEAANQHGAMETWLAVTLEGMLRANSCARLLLFGHSHGGAAAPAVAAKLEADNFADQVAFVGILDRVTLRYEGGSNSVPTTIPLLHLYELNERDHPEACLAETADADEQQRLIGGQSGVPIDRAELTNIEERDLTSTGVCHDNIDDDAPVHETFVDAALSHLAGP